MKKLFLFLFTFTVFYTTHWAQISSGRIEYKVAYEFESFEDKGPEFAIIDQYMGYSECIYEGFEDEITYVLEFDKETSLFYLIEEDIINTACLDKIMAVVGSMDGNRYNLNLNKVAHQYIKDKKALVIDEVYDIEITQETKKIQNFTCYKAHFYLKDEPHVPVRSVWFTPEIPFSYGPENYIGVPGLVLEIFVPTQKMTYAATKIEFNHDTSDFKKKIGDILKKTKPITFEEYFETRSSRPIQK